MDKNSPKHNLKIYLNFLNKIKLNNMTKKQLLKTIIEKHDKYSDLLWYARSGSENESIKGVKENLDKIETLYPNEVSELQGENSDWQHGFNSGVVAIIRYILAIEDFGLEHADEEFPMLDS
jgi:hypothetical protein